MSLKWETLTPVEKITYYADHGYPTDIITLALAGKLNSLPPELITGLFHQAHEVRSKIANTEFNTDRYNQGLTAFADYLASPLCYIDSDDSQPC